MGGVFRAMWAGEGNLGAVSMQMARVVAESPGPAGGTRMGTPRSQGRPLGDPSARRSGK